MVPWRRSTKRLVHAWRDRVRGAADLDLLVGGDEGDGGRGGRGERQGGREGDGERDRAPWQRHGVLSREGVLGAAPVPAVGIPRRDVEAVQVPATGQQLIPPVLADRSPRGATSNANTSPRGASSAPRGRMRCGGRLC